MTKTTVIEMHEMIDARLDERVVEILENNAAALNDEIDRKSGELESLRRFKDDVNEVRSGTECGIGVRNYNDVRSGDLIEVYDAKEVAREL